MNDIQSKWIEKAKESISAASEIAVSHPAISISRSYYAMFYLTQAVLLQKDLTFSKHSAVIAAFGQHFIKTGLIPPEFHFYLREAKEVRLLGDYDILASFSEEDACEQIKRAKEFLSMTSTFLK